MTSYCEAGNAPDAHPRENERFASCPQEHLAVYPVDPAPQEDRQFTLLVRRAGASPVDFQYRKFAGEGKYRVRVASRGAATVYETEHSTGWLRNFAHDLNCGVFGRLPKAPAEIADVLPLAERALVERGLPGVLEFLNQRIPYRFTALYRLEPGHVLHNVAVFDKHNHLDPLALRVVPLKESFCQFVLRDGVFLTETSGSDPRLAGHPYAGVVRSYVGVPVEKGDELRGSLCHFDIEDQRLPDHEYLLMSAVAFLLPRFLDAAQPI